jgi:hypothetical protein
LLKSTIKGCVIAAFFDIILLHTTTQEHVMKLSEQRDNLSISIKIKITDLLKTLSQPIKDSNETGLDLRAFNVTGDINSPYNCEILMNDYRIDHLTTGYGFGENGIKYHLENVINENCDALCQALDALETKGYPQYNVLVRAIVNVDADVLGDDFTFPQAWDETDRSGSDELRIALDTMVTVNANNKEDAVTFAKVDAPDIGLSCLSTDVELWVDTDQDDNVQRVE